MSRILLSPLGCLYKSAMNLRNRFYDKKIIQTMDVHTPVISVGNLTLGGTGKTPLVGFVIEYFKSRNIKSAIVSRGYRGNYDGVAKVEVESTRAEAAQLYGDEPVLFALRYPDIPVYVGRDRVSACEYLIQSERPQVIVADDAFQHRRLKRNLDIVILDASVPLNEYLPFPWGSAREGFTSLKRADVVVLSKVNWAQNDIVLALENRIKISGFHGPIIKFEYAFKVCRNLISGEVIDLQDLQKTKVMAFSGIGKPEGFARVLQQDLRLNLVGHHIFSDHYNYDEEDLKNILKLKHTWKAENVLTTEKDATKVRPLINHLGVRTNDNFWVIELGLQPISSIELFYAALDSVLI